eukprot:5815171-Pyramimonas_sp.AAC.1
MHPKAHALVHASHRGRPRGAGKSKEEQRGTRGRSSRQEEQHRSARRPLRGTRDIVSECPGRPRGARRSLRSARRPRAGAAWAE